MKNVIVVHPLFEHTWPFVADHLTSLWPPEDTQLIRLDPDESRSLDELIATPTEVVRLVSLMAPVSESSLAKLSALQEAVIYTDPYGRQADDAISVLEQRGVRLYQHDSEGYWGQSVAEFALALTLCALRAIPQAYQQMMQTQQIWDYSPVYNADGSITRAVQYCDSSSFSSGTLAGKQVRIVGAGNIGSRFGSFASFLGAEVKAWDPFASEVNFHRSGISRVRYLEQLLDDAEIFVPMLPITEGTRGLITADHIGRLPQGCLLVLATRAHICDMAAIRRRVMSDELSLAADVFDQEPLPLDDPLLGRHNVVHTPHMAGRTREANQRYADALASFFRAV